MYAQYLGAVFRRALQPTVRVTDGLQILAASAVPAIADATELPVPATDSVLAYIGAAAISFVILRLLFVAPYHVWKEQVGELGGLKLELCKPERIEFARMAKVRAKKRVAFAALIREMQWFAFVTTDRDIGDDMDNYFGRGLKLAGEAGVSESCFQGFGKLVNECRELQKVRRHKTESGATSAFTLSDNLVSHLHGRLTAEDLALRLPPDIESKTQQ
ncbi:hypothetical protein [Sphingosinicella rhizophila]|uniref:DUF4760 domain-containing protein n=1 Tax=Sphingosinicella rhizophila TaxID=3050082 RepID=A0ABU3Q9E4_9SPHN|nr:hypothetical protein [Sphingosinicella sp. GR2756]MDT9600030.1 hypothetical protein [Sphingosinicella sp. GR2756]